MQDAVRELVGLGPLPDNSCRDVEKLKRIQAAMARVAQPITDDDARALVHLFGPGDCFGAAWTLLHLIETAPTWPLEDCLLDETNEWIVLLHHRASRAQQ
jgi:hypothetical protein